MIRIICFDIDDTICTTCKKNYFSAKPKVKVIDEENNNMTQQDNTNVVDDKPAPKKRGRKPKGGKVVNVEPKIQQNEIIKQNVIKIIKKLCTFGFNCVKSTILS